MTYDTDSADSSHRVDAYVGMLEFADDYHDPAVDVTNEYRTAEHEIITGDRNDDNFVVQRLGGKPSTITINGVIRDDDTDTADSLGQDGPVYVRTERWTGTAVVTNADTSYRREKDKKGYWLHDITVDLKEVEKGEVTSGAVVHPDIELSNGSNNIDGTDNSIESHNSSYYMRNGI